MHLLEKLSINCPQNAIHKKSWRWSRCSCQMILDHQVIYDYIITDYNYDYNDLAGSHGGYGHKKKKKKKKTRKKVFEHCRSLWSIPIFFKVLMLIHISYFPRWLSFVAAATLASLPSSPLAPSWSTSASLSCSPPWSTSWSLAPASETTSTLSTTTRTTTTTIITITTTIQTTMVVVESAEELLAKKLTKYQRSAEKKQLSER